MPTFVTACPRNCYSTCTMRVTVEEGRLRSLEPDPANRATGSGLCLKGLSYTERVVAEDRILHPLRRTTGGGFERISWDDALDLLAERLLELRDRLGPRSLFFYAGSGTKGLVNRVAPAFWRLFGGCTTTYGDLCWPAGLEATRLTLGDNRHSAPWDLARARLIVFWGKNPAETNVHQMRFVDEAREAGAQVVVIDPRRTETAEVADFLIQPRPGTDGALALGVAHLLIRQGRVDREFVTAHVAGYEPFAARAAEFLPERVSEITDVPVPTLERLAELLGTVSPATLCAGYGMQRYTNSGQTIRAILALLALTGNLGRPGAGWVYANLQSHVFDAVKDPLALYPPETDDDPIRVSVSTALLGRHLREQQDPPIAAAWVERGNPVTQNPETGAVLEAFRALEFRVVVDQFLTDTAREADLVLPAKTLFEQTDVIGAYWHPYLQLKPKVLEPPGEVWPESEIYYRLGQRMGLPVEGVLPEPGDDAVRGWLKERVEQVPGLSLERLAEGPCLPPGHQEVAWSDRVFPTPSGKIELLSEEAARRWGADPLPDWRPPVEGPGEPSGSGRRYPLQLLTPNTKDRIHSQFGNLPSIRRLHPEEVVFLHPDDASERGLASGDRARVFNDRGAIELPVRLDHGIRPGCAVVYNGGWIADGAGVNLLSAARETDMGHGAAFHDNAVEVAPG